MKLVNTKVRAKALYPVCTSEGCVEENHRLEFIGEDGLETETGYSTFFVYRCPSCGCCEESKEKFPRIEYQLID